MERRAIATAWRSTSFRQTYNQGKERSQLFFSITGDLDKPNGNDKVVITVTPVLLTMTRPVTAQELEWGTTRPQTVSIVEYHDAVHGQVVTIEAQFKALDARDRIEESVRLMLQRTFGITWAGLAAGF